LSCILKDGHTKSFDQRDRSDVAEQIDCDDCLGGWRKRSFYCLGCDAAGIGVDVAEHRPGTCRWNRFGRCVEAERRHDHIVARANSHRPQAQLKCVGSVGNSDAVAKTVTLGKFGFQGVMVGSQHVGTAAENGLNRFGHRGSEVVVLGFDIVKRNAHLEIA
jgi:hypothetical protein